MEEITEETVRLLGFAPLIQLWAGICLLFFYEKLLKNFPLEKNRQQTEKLFEEFTANFQAYVDPEKMPQFEEYQGTKWEDHFLPTIRNMASLSFFYSVFVLACIGIEGTTVFSNRIIGIQLMNYFVWIYMFMAILFTGVKLFHTYWTPVIYAILLIAFFHIYPSIAEYISYCGWKNEWECTPSGVVVFTLFTLVSPLFLIFIHLFYDWLVLGWRRCSFSRLNKNFELLTGAIMGLVKPADFPRRLQKKVVKKVQDSVLNGKEIRTVEFNQYLETEIKDEFETFVTKWYQRLWRKIKPSNNFMEKVKNAFVYILKTSVFGRI